MAGRRHLTLTLSFSVDDDHVLRDRDDRNGGVVDSPFDEAINELRTIVQHEAARIFDAYEIDTDNPVVEYNGTTPTRD